MAIDPIDVLIWLVIGVIAGWLSSRVVMGGGLGPIWDLIVGIIGAVIASSWLHYAAIRGCRSGQLARQLLYKRGAELGLFRQLDETLLGSLFNSLCGAGAAYACGVAVRLIASG